MESLSWSLLMLLLVLALIPATLWVLKRLQAIRPSGGPRPIEVVAQLALGPRERLVTVRTEGRVLLLGVTAQQVALLTELALQATPDAAPPARPAETGQAFANALRSLRQRGPASDTDNKKAP